MAFTYNLNLTPATFAEAVFDTKQQLKTAGWVHQASGDGLGAFTTTPGNVNDVITAGAAGPNGMNNPSAWFVLKHPSSPRQLCFQRGGPQPVPDWVLTSPLTVPDRRAYAASAMHVPSGKMIMFGGTPNGAPNSNNGNGAAPGSSETWEYDPTTQQWTLLTPATTPAARFAHAMVYSPALGKIVMFGGSNAQTGNYNNETWTWDGTDWTLETPGASPSARRSVALSIDPVSGKVLMFGGRDADYPTPVLDETWTYDGVTWVQLTPATVPGIRESASMALHTPTNKVVLFGGGDMWTQTWQTDGTWTWDGTNWTLESPANTPVYRYLSPMVSLGGTLGSYDVMLFAGYGNSTLPEQFETNQWGSDLWAWTGTNWVRMIPQYPPDGRSTCVMAYDTVTKKLIVYGGTGNGADWRDTWVAAFTDLGDDYWYIKYSRAAGFTGGTPSTTRVPSAADEKVLAGAGPDSLPVFDQVGGFDGSLNYNIVADNAAPHGWWACGYAGGGTVSSWTKSNFYTNEEAAMVYDSARSLTVLFGGGGGGNGTREWDGSNWAFIPDAGWQSRNNTLAVSQGTKLVYDSARQRVVEFGGFFTFIGDNNQTWEWDGATWTQIITGASPPVRENHYMAFHAGNNRTVVIGGVAINPAGPVNMDTWTYDGTNWTLADVNPGSGGPGTMTRRYFGGCAYDAARGVTVVFGGINLITSALTNETWEWNGAAWSPGATGPSARYDLMMAYDAKHGYILLFGGGVGIGGGATSNQTWKYNGAWTQLFPATVPGTRQGGSMYYDPVRETVRMASGINNSGSVYFDEWEWNGTNWVQIFDLSPPHPAQFSAYQGPMVFDAARGEMVYLQSFGNFYTQSGVNPPPRRNHGMAYDSAANKTWMFGGEYATYLNDTLYYDGVAWRPVHPATSPPARSRMCMAYDISRNKTVMFGGFSSGMSSVSYNDTWEWDGTNWTQIFPATSPSNRLWASMCYDSVRNVMVLFGGMDPYTVPTESSGGYLNSETWTYDGVNWTQQHPAHSPRAHYGSAIAFDPVRGVVRLLGGQIMNSVGYQFGESWEWDGTDWTYIPPPAPVTDQAPGNSNMMVYDIARTQFVFVNSVTDGGTWVSSTAPSPSTTTGLLLFDPLLNPLPEDNDPFVFAVGHGGSLDDLFRYNTPQSYGAGHQVGAAYINYGVADREGFGAMFIATYDSSGWGQVVPNGPVITNILDTHNEFFPAFWFGDYDGVAYGFKGRSSLLYVAAQQVPDNLPWTAVTTVGPPLRMVVLDNMVAFPWDAITNPTGTGGEFDARVIDVTTPDQVTEIVENIPTQQLIETPASGGGSGVVVGSTIVRGGS